MSATVVPQLSFSVKQDKRKQSTMSDSPVLMKKQKIGAIACVRNFNYYGTLVVVLSGHDMVIDTFFSAVAKSSAPLRARNEANGARFFQKEYYQQAQQSAG